MSLLLLSKRQAAKLLGIGRDTLAELIAGGHIRTTDVLGHTRVAMEECQRFAREGCGPRSALTIRAAKVPRGRKALADSIRALVIT